MFLSNLIDGLFDRVRRLRIQAANATHIQINTITYERRTEAYTELYI